VPATLAHSPLALHRCLAVLALGVLGAGTSCAVVACARTSPDAAIDASPAAAADAGYVDASAALDDASLDAGRGVLTRLAATAQTSVIDTPWWPESGKGSKRIGYLRHGALAAAYDRPTVNEDCKEGWFELEVGGYVCGKAVTTELTSPKIRLAPKQPDHDAGMPYRYGVNLSDGTPLYRRVLPTEERKKYEPWLTPPKPSADEAPADTDKAEKTEKGEKTEVAGEGEESPSATPAHRGTGPVDAGLDAGRPKLKQLKGRGVLVRTMARGFYLALDRSFNSNGAKWWRTSFGFAVPFERIMVQPGVTKHSGSWFEAIPAGETAAADAGSDDEGGSGIDSGSAAGSDAGDGGGAPGAGTVAFVSVGFARKLEVSDDGKKITWGTELPKRTAVMLDGREATVSGVTYHRTTAGFWVRMMDLTRARPAFPADLRAAEKWIDVDLTRQALVAFEGTRPVFATLISSGRRNPQDKEKDFPTPTGSYRIREKHVTTTMDGDVASDGPYSIEDVPWVMYFQGSYALHAAFWHDSFGRMRSHGCVNMAPEDARTLFAWSDPPLPQGWHGVFSRDDSSGTRIIVHEDPPAKR
jgi:lipoprotein-anchoring transpeptidase ErfK/SrfK